MPYFSTLYTQSGLIPNPAKSTLSYNTDKLNENKKKFKFGMMNVILVRYRMSISEYPPLDILNYASRILQC